MRTILSKHLRNLLLVALATSGFTATAQLSFEKTRISTTAQPGTRSVTTSFVATNTGKKPVKITRVRTTCGCTTVSRSDDVVLPGKETTIEVEMEIQIDGGTQTKDVIVEIDRAPYRYQLTIDANVPEPVKITPKHLTWIADKNPAPRIIAITTDADVTIKNATSSDPNFTCELRRANGGWQLMVTPASLDKRRFGKITIHYLHQKTPLQRRIPVSVIQLPPPPQKKSLLDRLFSRD